LFSSVVLSPALKRGVNPASDFGLTLHLPSAELSFYVANVDLRIHALILHFTASDEQSIDNFSE
jgi:hypothetical protein